MKLDTLMTLFITVPSLLYAGSNKRPPKWTKNMLLLGGTFLAIKTLADMKQGKQFR